MFYLYINLCNYLCNSIYINIYNRYYIFNIIKNKKEGMNMLMKVKSKVGKANTINDSLRVIIPQNVKQILQLEPGDTLEWQINSENDKIVIIVEKSE